MSLAFFPGGLQLSLHFHLRLGSLLSDSFRGLQALSYTAGALVEKGVGGTDGFVRRPFLYSGFCFGFAGGVLSLVLVGTALWWLGGPIDELLNLYESEHSLTGMSPSTVLVLPLFSGTLGLLGAWLALLVSDAIFQGVLIAAMALASLMMLLPQPRLATQTLTPARITPTVHLAMFVIGLYGGFIQVGVGVLFIAVLYRLLRIDLAQVNVFKVFIILIYTLPALALFLYHDQVRWSYGLLLAVGSMSGAWLAVRVNMGPRGALWVRWLTLAVIGAIIVRLVVG
mgnify:CR=1 FL=1